MFGIVLFGAIITWIIILVTHLMFRTTYPQEGRTKLTAQAPLFPYLQLLGLGLLVAILVTMGLDREFWRMSIVVGIPWVMLVSGCYLVVRARRLCPEVGTDAGIVTKVSE